MCDMSQVSHEKVEKGAGIGLFCHQNQSCLKLPEMDRSGVKKISLMGGGAFLAPKLKLFEIA